MKIGLAIRTLRRHRRHTLVALAEHIGMTTSTLSRIETEVDKKISLQDTILLSRALDVSLEQLVALAEALDTPELNRAHQRSVSAKNEIKLLNEAGRKMVKSIIQSKQK